MIKSCEHDTSRWGHPFFVMYEDLGGQKCPFCEQEEEIKRHEKHAEENNKKLQEAEELTASYIEKITQLETDTRERISYLQSVIKDYEDAQPEPLPGM